MKKYLLTALSFQFASVVQATPCDEIVSEKISKLMKDGKEKEWNLEQYRDELINLKKEYIEMVSDRKCSPRLHVKAARDYNTCIDQADRSYERQRQSCQTDVQCKKDTLSSYNQRVKDCKEVSVHDNLSKSAWNLSNFFKR